jgi:adenylate cyclase
METPRPAPNWKWPTRQGLWLVACVPLSTQAMGSAFNIWYNLTHINPHLTAHQFERFLHTILIFNLIVYPIAIAVWLKGVFILSKPFRACLRGQEVPQERIWDARRRVINLPWRASLIASVAWLAGIPVFISSMARADEPLKPLVYYHLPISVLIAAFIAVTHAFFAVEILSQRLLYPVLFQGAHPANTPGAMPLSLTERGILWAVSAGAVPIVSLLLLILAPDVHEGHGQWFAISVGVVSMAFGLATAWLMGQLVASPIHYLRRAAQEVASGNLQVRVDLLRADDFGPLIDEFNHMVSELREKERIHETFGLHVGKEAARQILERDPGLGGAVQEVTVLFADVRNFTTRSENTTPQEIVALLNRMLTEAVEIVEERNHGMVNKFLGDGFMALFGAGDMQGNHAARAVAAGEQMLSRLKGLNRQLVREGREPLDMGIGIHTGPAVVGSIGSVRRLEYTAIGDTVNVASRVESLTKALGVPLLFTEATRKALPEGFPVVELPPQVVKGKAEAVVVYGVGGC